MLAAEGKAPHMSAHIGVLKALHAGNPEARSPGLMLISSSTLEGAASARSCLPIPSHQFPRRFLCAFWPLRFWRSGRSQ
jgi:hypothetical protein